VNAGQAAIKYTRNPWKETADPDDCHFTCVVDAGLTTREA